MQRRLAAILAADVVGYSRLMELDEAGTFERLLAHRRELFEPEIERHGGRIFKLMGDGLLAEFPSVVDAVACAVALQRGMAERNKDLPAGQRIQVRVGINLGDVIIEGEDRHGEGVNIAARLEQLAEPGGICISQQAHDQLGSKLDLAYDDLGEHLVKNIVKPVHVYRVRADGVSALRRRPVKRRTKRGAIAAGLAALFIVGTAAAWYGLREADPVLALPTGPAIAVLPFTNLSSNPDDAYFSVGLTEDIIAALSRFSGLLVFARESTKRFESESVDPQEVGAMLGARYVLAGSVRRSDARLRVTVKLLDAKGGTQLWSETYDRDLTTADIFAMQDEITARVVGIIGSSNAPLFRPEIQAEMRSRRPENLEAYQCVLLSTWVYDSFRPEAHADARDCLERAVTLEPGNALVWAHLAQMYFEEYKYGYNARPEPIERALAATQKALELDPQSQYANYMLALILYVQEPDFDAFYQTAERAIALNPNDAGVLADLGTWIAYSGQLERGTALIAKAMVLNPFHQSWWHWAFFLDLYHKRDYRGALAVQRKMDLPDNLGIQTGLAAVYGQLGDMEHARATLDHILSIEPDFAEDPRAWFVRRRILPELIEALMDGLGKAGFAVPPAGG